MNYELYFNTGKKEKSQLGEFNSDNTVRLNIEQVKEKILTTDYVQEALKENK